MNIARSIGIAALAATFALTGCSTAVDGAAQGASTETVCPDGYILTKIGKCVDATTTTTTSPTAAPNANPTTELPSVSACDGTQCDLTASDDEIDRLVSEALDDVTAMWANLNVTYTLHMYKDGIVGCDVNDDPNATGWVCAKQGVGGWNPTAMRTWASDRGASLEDTVRATIAHEVGHIVTELFGATHPDLMTNELRADCMAAGYSRWTVTTTDSAMEPLPLSRMKNVLYGSESARALDAGYTGTPRTCTEYTR